MSFFKTLVSRVAVGVAAGAAQQVGSQAASDWWKNRKRNKSDKQADEFGGEEELAPRPTEFKLLEAIGRPIKKQWDKYTANKNETQAALLDASPEEAPDEPESPNDLN